MPLSLGHVKETSALTNLANAVRTVLYVWGFVAEIPQVSLVWAEVPQTTTIMMNTKYHYL